MFLSDDDEILIESREARDGRMAEMPDEHAEEILNRVKALIFAVYQGGGVATTEQMAEFYEEDVKTIRKALERNRDEFDADGLKVLRHKALRDASDIMSLASKASQATIWTPRSALRLGMLLRDSAVAKQVRSLLIETIAQGGFSPPTSALQVQFRQALVTDFPETRALVTEQSCSTLYSLEEYDKIERHLRRNYRPGIRGYPHDEVVKEAVYLSARSDDWALKPEPELWTKVLGRTRFRYPDLISQKFLVQIGDQLRESIFVFDYKDPIVDESDVRECLYDREYLDLTKRIYQVDYVFLILFAPFGATPYAAEYVETSLPPEYEDFVRIMTTEEVFQFLNQQVARALRNGHKKSQITRNIMPLLRYEIPAVGRDGQIIRRLPSSSLDN